MLKIPDLTDDQREYLDSIKKEIEDEVSKDLSLENPYPKAVFRLGNEVIDSSDEQNQ